MAISRRTLIHRLGAGALGAAAAPRVAFAEGGASDITGRRTAPYVFTATRVRTDHRRGRSRRSAMPPRRRPDIRMRPRHRSGEQSPSVTK